MKKQITILMITIRHSILRLAHATYVLKFRLISWFNCRLDNFSFRAFNVMIISGLFKSSLMEKKKKSGLMVPCSIFQHPHKQGMSVIHK